MEEEGRSRKKWGNLGIWWIWSWYPNGKRYDAGVEKDFNGDEKSLRDHIKDFVFGIIDGENDNGKE